MNPIISIVIPHKNIPTLLQRCLDSIPQEEGLEVIVVDDNSNPLVVDFGHFPGADRPDTTIVFDKSGKGAGRARNLGMEKATGKWLVFADADDFFEVGGVKMLFEYQDATEDILFFNCRGVLSDDISKDFPERGKAILFNIYKQNHDETPFRINWPEPWGKMVRREMVEAHRFRFSEVRWTNDAYFQTMIGAEARKVKIVDRPLYVITLRLDSLSSVFFEKKKPSLEELQVRLGEGIKCQEYLQAKGLPDNYVFQAFQWLMFRHYPLQFTVYFLKWLLTDWHKVRIFLKMGYLKLKDRI